jgi:predicted Zn-dependent protease
MLRARFRITFILVALAYVSACSWFAQPEPARVAVKPVRDWVSEIRAEAIKAGSAFDIKLIQSPAIDALLQRVDLLEQQKAYAQANELLRQAQTIEPNNPLVLQHRAEAQLRAVSYASAEALALQSFNQSAQLGPLCVRNWLTIAAARAELKNTIGESEARESAKKCDVPPVQRL